MVDRGQKTVGRQGQTKAVRRLCRLMPEVRGVGRVSVDR